MKNSLICHRCGHFWKVMSLIRLPKKCPKCTSPYWDKDLGSVLSQKDIFIAVNKDTKEIIGKGTIKALRFLVRNQYHGQLLINDRVNSKNILYYDTATGSTTSIKFIQL